MISFKLAGQNDNMQAVMQSGFLAVKLAGWH
jgi:hypothetical protein